MPTRSEPYIWNPKGKVHCLSADGVHLGRVTYGPDGRYGPFKQEAFQVVLINQGYAEVHLNNHYSKLGPGDVVFFKPEDLVSIWFSKSVETVHSWATLDVEKLPSEQVESLHKINPLGRTSQRLETLFNLGLDSTSHPVRDHLSGYLHAIVNCILLEYLNQSKSTPTNPEMRYISSAQTWISLHYQEPISVNDIAKAAGITRQYLARLFRKHSIESPAAYMWHYRVSKAKALINETGLSLDEIADSTGFQSAFHLSRKIKEEYGISPKKMRDSSRSGKTN